MRAVLLVWRALKPVKKPWPRPPNQDSRAFRKSLIRLPETLDNEGLTPRLTGAGARSAEGTNTGHQNAEGMACVGVRVEPTVRLGRVVEDVHSARTTVFEWLWPSGDS